MACPSCGHPSQPTANFCEMCGARLPLPTDAPPTQQVPAPAPPAPTTPAETASASVPPAGPRADLAVAVAPPDEAERATVAPELAPPTQAPPSTTEFALAADLQLGTAIPLTAPTAEPTVGGTGPETPAESATAADPADAPHGPDASARTTATAQEAPPIAPSARPPDPIPPPRALPAGEAAPAWTPPPAAPPAPRAVAQSRPWAVGAHVSALVGGFMGGLPAFAGPLVVWLARQDEDPYAAAHGREALNFNLSVLLYAVALVLFSIVTFGIGLLLTIPGAIALALGWFVLSIVGAIRAAHDQAWRYPLTIRFFK